jgi:hypothetical protein
VCPCRHSTAGFRPLRSLNVPCDPFGETSHQWDFKNSDGSGLQPLPFILSCHFGEYKNEGVFTPSWRWKLLRGQVCSKTLSSLITNIKPCLRLRTDSLLQLRDGSRSWNGGVPVFMLLGSSVKWTARATAMIKAGEYRYISPVFQYNKETGAVIRLINAALTNNPMMVWPRLRSR